MANKVVLGSRPKNFKHTVTFQMLDGSQGSIEVFYKYRTKREFGALLDETKAAAELRMPTGEKAANEQISWEKVHDLGIEANADHLLAIVDSWNLDVEPSREAFEQMSDELPAAVNAIWEAYRKAIVEGRLGN